MCYDFFSYIIATQFISFLVIIFYYIDQIFVSIKKDIYISFYHTYIILI